MTDEQIKEISNSITCARILLGKDMPEKADNILQELQMNLLDFIINEQT